MLLVITGASGSGKTTAVRRILKYIDRPLYGFWTEKLPAEEGTPAPVYLHSFRAPIEYTAENQIGTCQNKHATAFPQVFDTLGLQILQAIPADSFVVLDEIGVMEQEAEKFQTALFALLQRIPSCIITVRDRHTPLLDKIRSMPNACCITAQSANDEAAACELAKKLKTFKISK